MVLPALLALLQITDALGQSDDLRPVAQSSEAPSPHGTTQKIDGTRFAIVGGACVAGMASIHIYQENGWWKDNKQPFHFREDLDYGLSVDKLGHFYGASVLTFVFSRSLQWAQFSDTDALLLGAGTSVLFQTFVEFQDGLSTWGFDRVDFAADVAGAFYPVVQHHVPFLKNFNFKFSYHPSDLLNEPGGIGFVGRKHIIFDDYEGQTIWLSLNVNTLLPETAESYWPDWLAVAIGYGARQVAGPDPHSVLLIALDYNVTEILPKDTWFLRTLGEALNFVHFPAPAVRISPDAIWYGLYF